MNLSVVIPTCNRVADLERCLRRLVPQVEMLGGCEIIVTDDAEAELTKKFMVSKFPYVFWTQGPRRGPAANRNHGAKTARGQWLLFLDDDLAPQNGFLDAIAGAIRDASRCEIFEGIILNDRPLPNLLWEAPFNNKDFPQLSCSAAFCIRAETFYRSGGFDERYGPGVYAEDMEFSARLLAMGALKQFVVEAVVVHPIRRRPGPMKLARRWEGMCINARDQGASGFRILWNLPWHALRVIQSRFRGRPFNKENLQAAAIFCAEWLVLLWYTPGWAWRWSKNKRSHFWREWVDRHGPAPKYGF